MPHEGDYKSMSKRRRKAKVSEVAEAIHREHPGMSMERKFKIANAAVSKMKRKRR